LQGNNNETNECGAPFSPLRNIMLHQCRLLCVDSICPWLPMEIWRFAVYSRGPSIPNVTVVSSARGSVTAIPLSSPPKRVLPRSGWSRWYSFDVFHLRSIFHLGFDIFHYWSRRSHRLTTVRTAAVETETGEEEGQCAEHCEQDRPGCVR
jgi:hypothetical protein